MKRRPFSPSFFVDFALFQFHDTHLNMLLLLMRHGIAQPLSDSKSSDDFHRALTRKGRKRARRAALGICRLAPRLDFLASSPKTRARQTAQIVRESLGEIAPPLTEWSELMEEDPDAITEKLRVLDAKIAGEKTVLLCGHEPHLSRLISQMLAGSPEVLHVELKKAGVCALQIEWIPQKMKQSPQKINSIPQKMKLLFHLTPRQLRKIGE